MVNYFSQLQQSFRWQSLFFRRALRTAIAVFISVLIYHAFGLTQGFWLSLTIVIVMQATTAATLRKGLQRFLGTLLGIIIGSLLVMHIHNAWVLDALLIFFLFIAYYMKAFNLVNYGIFVVPLTIMIVFLVSTFLPKDAYSLIWARLYDTTLGAVIAVAATLLIFPNSLKNEVASGIDDVLLKQYAYLQTILILMSNKSGSHLEQALTARRQFQHCLSENRRLFSDWVFELWFKTHHKKLHKKFLEHTEKLGQLLLALHHLARQEVPADLQETFIWDKLETNIFQIVQSFSQDKILQIPDFTEALKIIDQVVCHTLAEKAFLARFKLELQSYRQNLFTLSQDYAQLKSLMGG